MGRLAEYLSELAKLMGTPERVHFANLKKGSAVVTAYVEQQAVPKVRQRVTQAKEREAPADVQKPYKKLNELLRNDNARGDLKVGDAKILQFPGRDEPRDERIGPFNEHTEIDGVLQRIGGIDQTAHAWLQDSDGRDWFCIVSRDTARRLAQHLYGRAIRVSGAGRWQRNEEGKWELISMRVSDFRVLNDDELPTLVGRLRAVEGSGWREIEDPLAVLMDVREGDEGLH
jgi:hypothetical protein